MAVARGRYLGMESEIISAQEAHERMPLLDPQHFVGAVWDPMEGHVDPSGVTHAYGVGLLEISNFANYEVTGSEAAEWLDNLLPNRLPKPGRMVLSPMLDRAGRLIGDFTLAGRDERHFFVTGSGAAEQYHMRWFEQCAAGYDVNIVPRSLDMLGLQIAGPKSRELL